MIISINCACACIHCHKQQISVTLGVLSLSKFLEVVDMTVEGLPHGVHIVIGDAKLLAGLTNDGSDERIVGLDDSREEVVSCLMIESSREHVPEPTVCGIVLSCGHLQLSPVNYT